jgi:hypothetical protein
VLGDRARVAWDGAARISGGALLTDVKCLL